jgi:GntR family transcriptional repressor for pyruvate dehydrogenase complex
LSPKSQKKPVFKPLPSKRAFEEISDQIKNLIHSGVFKPGDKLPPERDLARQFNVGRMAVREALRVLEDSGFIQIKQGSNGGSFIKEPEPSTVSKSLTTFAQLSNITLEQLTEAKLAVELAIIESVIQKITDKELEKLHRIIEDSKQAVASGTIPLSYNVDFHLALARTTGNPLLESFLSAMMNLLIGFMGKGKPESENMLVHIRSHEALYKAIAKRDLNKARRLIVKHVLDVGEHVGKAALQAKSRRST